MSRTIRKRRRTLVVAGVLVLLAIGFTGSASAYTASGKKWGGYTVPVVQGQNHSDRLPTITFPSRTVSRSRSYRGTQVISVFFKLYEWHGQSGSYTLYNSRVGTVRVGAGDHATFAPRTFEGITPYTYYTAFVNIYWRKPSGKLIGYRLLNFVNTTDYQCVGVYAYCNVAVLPSGYAGIYFDPLG